MTLKQKIEENSVLLRCMDPSRELLFSLRSVPVVKDRVSAIKQQSTVDDKNDALIDCLLEAPADIQESVIDEFISALRSSGQEHVANIFRRESDKVPMSDEHYDTLTAKQGQLCQFIDPENGLLDELVGTGVISSANKNDIRSMPGYNEKVRKLIEVMSRKSDDAFDDFIKALNQTGQSHVTYMLTGEGNSRPLTDEYRKRLLSSPRVDLVKTMESKTSGLITALMDKGVFSTDDQQRVTGVQPDTTDDRNEIIMDLIARKSQSDFWKFIAALNDTNQTHVVVKLVGANVIAKIKTVYESGTDVEHIHGVDAELLQYMREVFQSNGDVMKRLSELLSSNGVTVTNVGEGCIEVTFACVSVESVHNFRELNDNGKLEQMLNETFCFQYAKRGLKSLKVAISDEQFDQCAAMFARWIPMTSEHRNALLSSEESLVDNMTVSDDLLDKLSLCPRRRQAIERAETHKQQVKTLIDIVSRQPDSAFAQLINVLKDTNQHEAEAVITGDSRSAMKSKGNDEVQEAYTQNAWISIDRDLEYLLNLIIKAELGYMDETFRPVFYRICVASRGVAMSLHNLREHYSVPISRTSVDEEAEHTEYTPEMFPTQEQHSFKWQLGIQHHPGESFPCKRCITLSRVYIK